MRTTALHVILILIAALQLWFATSPAQAADAAYRWRNVAIGGGGYVTGVFCHPREQEICYIRTDVGGFYRWEAQQAQWIPLTDHFTSAQSNYYGGEALALDPQNPNIVYIAAGKYTAEWAGKGSLFKSTDRGATWTKLPLDLPMGGNENHRWGGERLVVSPVNSKLIFFGSRTQGLWRSTDAGASWQTVPGFTATLHKEAGVLSVLFDPAEPTMVYANAYGDGIYQSRDSGETWAKLSGSPANALRLAVGTQGRLYATTEGPTASALKPLPEFRNGAMTEGTDMPTGWGPSWGKVKGARDTQVFKVGPASLRLWNEDPANTGTGGQTFDAPRVPFLISGSAKVAGTFETATVSLQVFDGGWKQLQWIDLLDVKTATDWRSFSRDINLPGNAAKCLLVVNIKGTGQVWLDEVQVLGSPIAPDEALPGVLIKGTQPGVMRYDGKGIWTPIAPRCPTVGFCGLTVNPKQPNEIIVGGAGQQKTPMFLSRDAGQSWQPLFFTMRNSVPWQNDHFFNSNTAAISYDLSGRVWFTDWYGVWRMDAVETSPVVVTNYVRGLEELVIFSLTAPPAGPELFTGVADVDGFTHTLDTTAFPAKTFNAYGKIGPWYQDTYSVAYCAAQPTSLVRVGGNRWNNMYGGATSDNGGKSWKPFALSSTNAQILRVAMSATQPLNFVVVLRGKGAQVTRNGGATWTPVTGLPNGPNGPWYWGQPLAADPVEGSTYYYYAGGKVYRCTDGGSTFAVVNTQVPSDWAAQLKVAPGVSGELWLGTEGQGLWYSRDGGTTFTKVAGITRLNAMAVGKALKDGSMPTVYLHGTIGQHGEGVYRSLDRGTTWQRINDSKFAIGDEPKTMEASQQLPGAVYLGTNGRGVYVGIPADLVVPAVPSEPIDARVPLVLAFDMEPDAQDATKLVDAGPFGSHGVIEGIADGTTPYVEGKRGKALHFDGEQLVAKIGNARLGMLNQVADQFTITAWINPDSLGRAMPILAKRDRNVGQPFALFLTADKRLYLSACYGPAWYSFNSDKASFEAKQWTHVAVTFKRGEGCSFYVNGAPVGRISADKVPTAVVPNTQPLQLGMDLGWNPATRKMEPVKFTGAIDALRIYPVALTDEQVAQDRDNQLKSCPATKDDCLAQ